MKCMICGCTDDRACCDGCYWVAEELCNQCVATYAMLMRDPMYLLPLRVRRFRSRWEQRWEEDERQWEKEHQPH